MCVFVVFRAYLLNRGGERDILLFFVSSWSLGVRGEENDTHIVFYEGD